MRIGRTRRVLSHLTLWAALSLVRAHADEGPRATAPRKPIRIALRYDDCSARSPADLEARILAACARAHVPITFGVVPMVGPDAKDPAAANGPLPPGRVAALKAAAQAGVLEIALHGFSHVSGLSGSKSEFGGIDPQRQDSLVTQGLAALRDLEPAPATFIPPWNAYDASTLSALQRHGFRTLSALAGGPWLTHPSTALAFVPATCLLPELRAAVDQARRSGGGTIVPYFHPYEFKELDPHRGLFSFAEFAAAVEWIAAQPDAEATTLGALGKSPEAGLAKYAAYSRWHALTPDPLERALRAAYRVYPLAAFPIGNGGLWLRLAILAGYALAALPAAVPAWAAARALGRRRSAGSRPAALILLAVAGILGFAAAGIGLLHGRSPYLWAGMASLACFFGVWRGFFPSRKRP